MAPGREEALRACGQGGDLLGLLARTRLTDSPSPALELMSPFAVAAAKLTAKHVS